MEGLGGGEGLENWYVKDSFLKSNFKNAKKLCISNIQSKYSHSKVEEVHFPSKKEEAE